MKLEEIYSACVKGLCYLMLVAMIIVSLYAFDKMSPKDRDMILIFMMMSQPQ